MRLTLITSLLCILLSASTAAEPVYERNLYISSNRDGLWHATLDVATGRLGGPRRVVDNGRNQFLVLSPSGHCLYGVSGDRESSRLSAYKFREEGELESASEAQGSLGGATHLNVSPDGRYLSVAYYGGGGVSIHHLPTDCRLGEPVLAVQHSGSSIHPERQQRSHPHWGGFSADSRRAYFTDLGTDEIWVYQLDESAGRFKLQHKVAAPAGSGPRHLSFSPDGRFAYVSDELTASVSIYMHDSQTGQLTWKASLPAAAEAQEAWHNVSHIEVTPSGDRLYVMNRGFDRVSVFSVNRVDGSLSPVMREPVRGSVSRHFALDPQGHWFIAAGVASNHLASFAVEPDGRLAFTRSMAYVPGPNSIVIN